MPRFFIWSGSLQERETDASDEWTAIEVAVRKEISDTGYCALGPATRVSTVRGGEGTQDDVWVSPPYEDQLPGLYEDDDLNFAVLSSEDS
jgi:hypothetical protein